VWTHSFPIAKEPRSLGEHLRKRRFASELRQSEAAQRLEVSNRTLSLWETDRVVPTQPFHLRIAAYLGYDPFEEASP
jgi:DNA-binding XRE family transcriptional regulator